MRPHLKIRSATAAVLGVCLAIQAPAAGPQFEATDAGMSMQRLQRIAQMIERRIAARDISGAVTLVARKGRVVHFEASGLMDIDSKRRMSRDAIFRIASMTKPITAVAILMLNEEGKLLLTDPVAKFIPQYGELKVAVGEPAVPATAGSKRGFHTVPADRQITIQDLLTHTSGIVTEAGSLSNREAAKAPRQPAETLADYIPRLAVVPLEFQPGTRWQYSPGAGFDALGRIVEIVSGQSFDRFLRERIFEPLGMKNTAFKLDESQTLRLATRYERTETALRKLPPRATSVYFSGGGGLASTAEDYRRFAQMLLNRGQLDGKRLLSARSVETMSAVHIRDTLPGRPPGEGWGLGVRVISDAAARNTWLSNGSFGWTGAQSTHFWVDPEEQLLAILMIQTPAVGIRPDFETLVMQAIVGE